MINNEQPGLLNAKNLLLLLTVAAIAPYESEGVHYALIRGQSCYAFQAILLEETCPRCNKKIYQVSLPNTNHASGKCLSLTVPCFVMNECGQLRRQNEELRMQLERAVARLSDLDNNMT